MKDESLDTSTARTALFYVGCDVSRSACTVIRVHSSPVMTRVHHNTD